MTRRAGNLALAISLVILFLCASLVGWRLLVRRAPQPPPVASGQNSPGVPPGRWSPSKISTIIDLPGDPVLVRRGPVSAPKELFIGVPAKVDQDQPKAPVKAFFVNSTLVSTTGEYMGKFPEAGQEADALATQLAVNSEQTAGLQTQAQIDAGSDDDGGADTPADAQSQFLTEANSNQLQVAGAQDLPQLKETILRISVAQKLSDVLIANGYSAESAQMVESAAKNSPHHLDTLPSNSVALAVGELDTTGEYRVKQIAVFENGEYVFAIAWKDDGGYDEAAEPVIPSGLLDNVGGAADAAMHFAVVDGVYSALLRNGLPEAVIREAIQLINRLADLKAPLQADETVRIVFQSDFRDKPKSAGRVIYVGLHGGAVAVDCYSFEGKDGYFRCFDPKAGVESKSAEPNGRAPAFSFGNSGAESVGGILPPIRGAPITSLFGMRFHPILHILRLHAGVDFGAPIGSQVRAAADGKVEIAGPVSGFGNHVRIQHAGFETSYSHLSEIPESIRPGVEVKQGDIIALSGNTGLSTGPHLHFEFYLNREAVDPLPHFGSEVQAAAATLTATGFLPPARPSDSASSGATQAEISSFPAIKAYIDAKLAELMK
jgi:murein DD-endopeptidase MepM/ murein hydrolase activator NlpD